jgi:hypothetical protein
MVTIAAILPSAAFAIAVVLVLLGILSAWTASNAITRLAGVAIALLGGICALAALGAPPSAQIVAGAAAFAYLLVGAAIVVLVQENYGSIEAAALDSADSGAEPPEPRGER